MQGSGIENICRGEERLHRILYEISKVLDHLVGADAVNSPILWASELFQRDRQEDISEAMKLDLMQAESRQDFACLTPLSPGQEPSFSNQREA